jgi:hypothetical protein
MLLQAPVSKWMTLLSVATHEIRAYLPLQDQEPTLVIPDAWLPVVQVALTLFAMMCCVFICATSWSRRHGREELGITKGDWKDITVVASADMEIVAFVVFGILCAIGFAVAFAIDFLLEGQIVLPNAGLVFVIIFFPVILPLGIALIMVDYRRRLRRAVREYTESKEWGTGPDTLPPYE